MIVIERIEDAKRISTHAIVDASAEKPRRVGTPVNLPLGPLRGRRICVVVAAALLTAVVAGASAQTSGAVARSTILFTPTNDGLVVFSSDASGGPDLQVNLAADTPALPKKVVVEVPSGYTLDLSGEPGSTVGDASVAMIGTDAESFATGNGRLFIRDAADPIWSKRAETCAPGKHDAVWGAATSLAGQQMQIVVAVDQRPGAGYLLHLCTSQLASDAPAGALISLGIEGMTAPTDPGEYRWRAHVIPQARPSYELQAVLELPAAVSLTARTTAHGSVTLTGRVIERGTPLSRAVVSLVGQRGENDAGDWLVRTDANGFFRKTIRLKKTTDFVASVEMGIASCDNSSEPGGCLGATSVPPSPAYATAWVSPPTGAVRGIRNADQRIAEKLTVHAADLPSGFDQQLGGSDACLNPRHESRLTITGESPPPAFSRYEPGDAEKLSLVLAVTRVYATTRQAKAAFAHQARISTMRCLVHAITGSRKPPLKSLPLKGGHAIVRAFRMQLGGAGASLTYDAIFLQRGRAVTSLRVALVNTPSDLETNLVTHLATRMG